MEVRRYIAILQGWLWLIVSSIFLVATTTVTSIHRFWSNSDRPQLTWLDKA